MIDEIKITNKSTYAKQETKQTRALELVTRSAHSVKNCITYLNPGLVVGSALGLFSWSARFLASQMGVIDSTNAEMLQGMLAANPISNSTFDVSAIMHASCPVRELVAKINEGSTRSNLTVSGIKLGALWTGGFIAPVYEEIALRGIIQGGLLSCIPSYIAKAIAPGTTFDSTTAKAVRIAVTALIFSALHLSNSGFVPDWFLNMQLVATLMGGIAMGILKESDAGFEGAVIAHMTNNVISLSPFLWSC